MHNEIRQKLESMANTLNKAPRRPVLSATEWADDIPSEPGVYALWEGSRPIYVGETSSLRHRMRDLGRSVNHTCRRKIAAKLELGHVDESALSAEMAVRYTLSFMPVSFGRVELEEYLTLRWKSSLFNSPSRRLLHGISYSWVEPALE